MLAPGANLDARRSSARRRSLPARGSSPTATASRRCCIRCVCCNGVAFGLVLLLSAAAAAAVVLAARGALDTHRFTIEVMHGIGATDLQVTHLFQRKIAIDALIGSLAGALAAARRPAAARERRGVCRRADRRRDAWASVDLLILALLAASR